MGRWTESRFSNVDLENGITLYTTLCQNSLLKVKLGTLPCLCLTPWNQYKGSGVLHVRLAFPLNLRGAIKLGPFVLEVEICFHSPAQKFAMGASLVVQWLRSHLPMQGTRVWSLVWEDPTCHRATKPVRHNYWACALEPASHNYWAHVPQLLKPACLEPVLCNKRSHCNEKPAHRNEEQPPLAATRERLRAATKTQHSQNLIN